MDDTNSLSLSRKPRAFVRYDVIRNLLSIVLLTAAGLKVHSLTADSHPHEAWLASRPLQIATISVEVGLAIGLISSPRNRGVWASAIGFFAIVAGVSLFTAIHGLPCCCVGSLKVPPWCMFGIDVAAIVTLCCCVPRRGNSSTGTSRWFEAKVGHIAAATASVLMAGAFLGMAATRLPAGAAVLTGHEFPIEVEYVDFGTIPQGGRAERLIELSNRTSEEVEIASISTTCNCLQLDLAPRLIAAGGSRAVRVLLDLREESSYVGNLEAYIEGITVNGRTGFRIVVSAAITCPK
jgi:hypothetical protein